MDHDTVILFTRNGLGQAPVELAQKLALKYLTLLPEVGGLPGTMLFYTEAVKLACSGSPALAALQKLEACGVRLVLCQTCLDFFGLSGEVRVGIVGGMGDILEALDRAGKVISV